MTDKRLKLVMEGVLVVVSILKIIVQHKGQIKKIK